VALGANLSDARIKGVSTIDGMSSAGGLLALPTNIGHVRENHFAVVPDVSAKIGYQVAPSMRIHAGYSFLYWTNVIRPGGVIDTSVNPTQLPPGTLAGPGRPQPQFNRSDLWAHGINLGLVFNF